MGQLKEGFTIQEEKPIIEFHGVSKTYNTGTHALEDVNIKIQEYFGKENVNRTNLGYNYVDEENDVVVVGLIDNSKEKQDEFIYNVFSNCCGTKYIKYIKDNSIIEFRKTEPITTSNNN